MTTLPVPDITQCPECDAWIVKCDNNVWLDVPAEEKDGEEFTWNIMPVGPLFLAAVWVSAFPSLAHRMHEHQPPEIAG